MALDLVVYVGAGHTPAVVKREQFVVYFVHSTLHSRHHGAGDRTNAPEISAGRDA